ncbi:Uncharacterized lipoprotein yedD precursor [Erwinia amylovora Ea644]|uniref:lipoprotein YedD n=1 Tax=Erwinia amylovora TaxID=552 RepID=UPI0002CCA115|nr:lipoprotein YedD [Erwinia amylovora]CCP03560.1 Uncharacterized lipoprotein yedD precursor [Erwinia amylovora Ea644]CCP07591.1 Uncharacterized lipoprotein yedD precursor [Erwinia amylovora MR1]
MKKWIIATVAAMVLNGCAELPNYSGAVKTPAPAELVGNWQTFGPQSGLVSDQAKASLLITAQGETLDCRQWQRVLAKPGKLTRADDQWVNVNNQQRVMPIELKGNVLHYDRLILQKVAQPTAECQQQFEAVNKPVGQASATAGQAADKVKTR